MISKYNSDKIKFISFFLMVLVVILHAQNVSSRVSGFNPDSFNIAFQTYISGGICSIAVPFFFMISGFFFFKGIKNLTLEIYKEKIYKRIRTILIPYLIVSALGILFFLLLQAPSFTRSFFYNKLVVDYTFIELVKAWLIGPLPYQLWFIRNLMIICLMSPVIYFIIKKIKVVFILFLLIMWLVFSFVSYNLITSIVFFCIGGFLSIRNIELPDKRDGNSKQVYLLIMVWFILIYLGYIGLKSFEYDIVLQMIKQLSTIIGIVSVWFLYDILHIKNADNKILKYSFFLYLFHEPMLTIVIKLLFYMGGKTPAVSTLVYIISPIVVISVCIIVGMIMNKKTPVIYNLITGNR